MTDRELLEWAAKACAWTSHTWSEEYCSDGPYGDGFVRGLIVRGYGVWSGVPWNPLTDDGDALRLAVGLGMLNEGMPNAVKLQWELSQAGDPDPYADTRRAIVRAAAAIGQSRAATSSTDSLK